MKINVDGNKVTLELNGKTIEGDVQEQNESYYFNCKYVANQGAMSLQLDDLKGITAQEFCDDTCVPFLANTEPNNYLEYVFIGKKENAIYYRSSFYMGWVSWQENTNLNRIFQHLREFVFNNKYNAELFEVDDGFVVDLIFSSSTSESIIEPIDISVSYFSEVLGHIITHMTTPDSFVSQFNFPQEYRHVFTQYLTYFGKFLEDLGISGEVSIEHKDGKTILKVASDQKQETLDQINAALLSYISLPSSDISTIVKPAPDLESQIRMQQLLSAVDHMKSQLNLSKAMISVKEREIELLHATNNQLRTNLIPRAELSSDLTDYWEPLDGVKIKAYKGDFFEIDIPLWVDKVKKRLQKK
jgi:hypothetical protein